MAKCGSHPILKPQPITERDRSHLSSTAIARSLLLSGRSILVGRRRRDFTCSRIWPRSMAAVAFEPPTQTVILLDIRSGNLKLCQAPSIDRIRVSALVVAKNDHRLHRHSVLQARARGNKESRCRVE